MEIKAEKQKKIERGELVELEQLDDVIFPINDNLSKENSELTGDELIKFSIIVEYYLLFEAENYFSQDLDLYANLTDISSSKYLENKKSDFFDNFRLKLLSENELILDIWHSCKSQFKIDAIQTFPTNTKLPEIIGFCKLPYPYYEINKRWLADSTYQKIYFCIRDKSGNQYLWGRYKKDEKERIIYREVHKKLTFKSMPKSAIQNDNALSFCLSFVITILLVIFPMVAIVYSNFVNWTTSNLLIFYSIEITGVLLFLFQMSTTYQYEKNLYNAFFLEELSFFTYLKDLFNHSHVFVQLFYVGGYMGVYLSICLLKNNQSYFDWIQLVFFFIGLLDSSVFVGNGIDLIEYRDLTYNTNSYFFDSLKAVYYIISTIAVSWIACIFFPDFMYWLFSLVNYIPYTGFIWDVINVAFHIISVILFYFALPLVIAKLLGLITIFILPSHVRKKK